MKRKTGKSAGLYYCRWSHLLKQQSSITAYHLPTKENKLPFFIFICSKQTEVCHFHFPFAANRQKLRFPLVLFSICGIPETWGHGHGIIEMETEKHGDIDMRHGNREKWRFEHGDMEMETWTLRHWMKYWGIWCFTITKNQTENRKRKLAIFLNPFTICLPCKQKFVICPFVDEETNGSYPFANGLNRLNGHTHLCLLHFSNPLGRGKLKSQLLFSGRLAIG